MLISLLRPSEKQWGASLLRGAKRNVVSVDADPAFRPQRFVAHGELIIERRQLPNLNTREMFLAFEGL
jgi:hypothetical protein